MLPRSEPLVLRAPATGDLEVHVRDQNGVPLAYGVVYVATSEDAAQTPTGSDPPLDTSREVETDVDGVARLRGVAAGELRVQAVCGERDGEPSSAVAQGVLRPDETLRLDVEMIVGRRAR